MFPSTERLNHLTILTLTLHVGEQINISPGPPLVVKFIDAFVMSYGDVIIMMVTTHNRIMTIKAAALGSSSKTF
jgi:hypothetical protein